MLYLFTRQQQRQPAREPESTEQKWQQMLAIWLFGAFTGWPR